jgi:hypothetical protein
MPDYSYGQEAAVTQTGTGPWRKPGTAGVTGPLAVRVDA